MNFRQHIPPYIMRNPVVLNNASQDDIMNLDCVKTVRRFPHFSHYAISGCHHLMAVSNKGYSWHVLGRIDDISKLTLPIWDGGKYKAKHGWKGLWKIVTVYGNDLESVCGDELRMKDGSVLTRLVLRHE